MPFRAFGPASLLLGLLAWASVGEDVPRPARTRYPRVEWYPRDAPLLCERVGPMADGVYKKKTREGREGAVIRM